MFFFIYWDLHCEYQCSSGLLVYLLVAHKYVSWYLFYDTKCQECACKESCCRFSSDPPLSLFHAAAVLSIKAKRHEKNLLKDTINQSAGKHTLSAICYWSCLYLHVQWDANTIWTQTYSTALVVETFTWFILILQCIKSVKIIHAPPSHYKNLFNWQVMTWNKVWNLHPYSHKATSST